MSHHEKPNQRPRRPRLFRYSLRALLLATTVLAIWLAIQVNHAANERRARRALAPLVRMMQYDYEFDREGNYVADTRHPCPTPLREIIGDEFFSSTHTIRFDSQVTDEDLSQLEAPLGRLSGLRSIDLATAQDVSDEGLQALAALSRVESLDLRRTSVSNSGLKFVVNMPNLESLQLGTLGSGASSVDDDCLLNVRNAPALRSLYLWGEGFSDAGLEHMAEMKQLRMLWLQKTRVTDDGLPHIAKLTNLQVLALESCDVTDAALKRLAPLNNLKRLYLSYTQVTDEGLAHLAAMQQLERISLRGSQATSQGIARLQQRLPNCDVR